MAERLLSVRLRAVVDGFEAGMARAAAATDRVSSRAKNLEKVGAGLTMGLTVPLAAVSAVSLKSAISFESAFTGVRKTVNGTAEDFAKLEDSIVSMASRVPSTREEIAAVMETAGQLGIDTSDIEEFTSVVIDLGNATNLVGQEGATLLARFANVTQMPQAQFRNLGSAITDLGNNFATTEAEIAEMATRLAGAGTAIGLTEADLLGLSAALTSVNVYAEMGGSAFSSTFLRMQASIQEGGDKLQRFAAISGMTSQAFASLFESNPMEALTRFVEGIKQASDQGMVLSTVLGSVGIKELRARDAITRLANAGDLLRDATTRSSKAFKDNVALTREAELRYQTTASKMAIARNQITEVARQTGNLLVPALRAGLDLIGPISDGFGGLATTIGKLPAPLQAVGGGMVAIAIAAGPAMWGLAKLWTLYAPVTAGVMAMTKAMTGFVGSMRAIAAAKGVSTLQAFGSWMASAGMAFGPQMLVMAAAVTALSAAFISAKRANESFARSHETSANYADRLAKSLRMSTKELKSFSDEAANPLVVSVEQFALDNSDLIQGLNELDSMRAKQDKLMQIGYRLRLQGASPEQVIESVRRVAEAAGVKVPIELTIEGLDDAKVQVDAAVRQIRGIADTSLAPQEGVGAVTRFFGTDKERREAAAQLKNVAQAASDAYNVGDMATFVSIMGESEKALDGNALGAANLAQSFEELSGVQGLSMKNTTGFISMLEEMSSKSSAVPAATKERIAALLEETKTLEGNARVSKIVELASKDSTWSMDKHAEATKEAAKAADGAAGSTGDLAGAFEETVPPSEDLKNVLDSLSAKIAVMQIDFNAGAAAAQAFGDSIAKSTQIDDKLKAGLTLGAAFKDLRKGLTGTSKSSESASDSIKRLADEARSSDSKMGGLETRLGALAAAGDAFTKSIESSSMWDDQISSALALGEAFGSFSKTYRRLPADLDMVALATGKVRPRAAEAIKNMLALGKSATDYLATLIEMGQSENQVRGEAARMRGEYADMFTQMGMTTAQVDKYIEAMGLAPTQIDTAVRLSGIESARFALSTYIDLLGDRIPDSVATKVIADIESGDIASASKRLAEYAKTADSAGGASKRLTGDVMELPKVFDPLTAALGGYTDAQQAALDAVIRFGEGATAYLSQVAHSGDANEIREQANRVRDAFLDQLAAFGIVGDAAQQYLDLVGLSDWQIESGITLSGDAEAMTRIQIYAQFLGDNIPEDVMTEVLAHVDEGNLQAAADRLAAWRQQMEANTITFKVQTAMENWFPMVTPAGQAMQNWFPGYNPAAGWKPFGHAAGGRIRGVGSDTSDSNLRAVSNNEFMIRASSAKRLGYDRLEAVNASGMWPEAVNADSGRVDLSPLASKLAALEAAFAAGGRTVTVGDINVVSPVASQTPARIVSKIGASFFREGL